MQRSEVECSTDSIVCIWVRVRVYARMLSFRYVNHLFCCGTDDSTEVVVVLLYAVVRMLVAHALEY